MNLTADQKAVLLEAVNDYIYVYENHSKMVERVKAAREVVALFSAAATAGVLAAGDNAQDESAVGENVASLKTELAAALADIIEYRRMRYADSAVEESRYRELTGHHYDDE